MYYELYNPKMWSLNFIEGIHTMMYPDKKVHTMI